jgi:hypothetical protein
MGVAVRAGLEGAGVVAIGMALMFAGYAVGIWGYCLVAGYDVPFARVFSGTWAPPAAPAKTTAQTQAA